MSRSGKCQLFITRTQGTQSFTWEACSSLDLTQLQHLPQYLNTISSGKSQTEKGGKMRLIILFFNIPHPCLASLSCLLEGSLEEQAIFYLQGIVKKKKTKTTKQPKKRSLSEPGRTFSLNPLGCGSGGKLVLELPSSIRCSWMMWACTCPASPRRAESAWNSRPHPAAYQVRIYCMLNYLLKANRGKMNRSTLLTHIF